MWIKICKLFSEKNEREFSLKIYFFIWSRGRWREKNANNEELWIIKTSTTAEIFNNVRKSMLESFSGFCYDDDDDDDSEDRGLGNDNEFLV